MGDLMNLILHTVMQEKQRIEYMLQRYQRELDGLPKGTISEKAVGGKVYYYLKYRDGKKVVSQYVSRKEIETVRALRSFSAATGYGSISIRATKPCTQLAQIILSRI